MYRVAESAKNQLLRDFRRRSIFVFCNDIGTWTCATARPQLAKADNAFQGASVGQPTEPCLRPLASGGPVPQPFYALGGPRCQRHDEYNSRA